MAIVMSPFTVFVNTFVNGRLLGYTPWMQFRDMAPSAALTSVMACFVLVVRMALRPWLAGFAVPSAAYATELAIVVPVGIATYLALSLAFRPKPLLEACSLLLPVMQKRCQILAGSMQWILKRDGKSA